MVIHRAEWTFLSRTFMITRISIAFEDLLASSIAPQGLPHCHWLIDLWGKLDKKVLPLTMTKLFLGTSGHNTSRKKEEKGAQMWRSEGSKMSLLKFCWRFWGIPDLLRRGCFVPGQHKRFLVSNLFVLCKWSFSLQCFLLLGNAVSTSWLSVSSGLFHCLQLRWQRLQKVDSEL